jgi:multidrug efflux pump subunit AcrA (membrane-fusion protein)
MLDLVPSKEELVIEAHLRPTDVERVRPGLTAEVVFPVLGQGTAPRLHGAVTYLAADTVADEATHQSFYRLEVRVPPAELTRLGTTLRPGMPAEVFIATGARTAFQYLTKPLLTRLQQAMRA